MQLELSVINMSRDLYAVLEITRSASSDEVKAAYRKQAYQWHPDRHTATEKEGAELKFKEASRAYEVLSDPRKREAYDCSGGESDVNSSDFSEAYPFQHPNELFDRFFGARRANFFQEPGQSSSNTLLKDMPCFFGLKCTLPELYSGCQKKWKVTKHITDACKRTMQVEKVLQIDIHPGWQAGTKVTFEGEGDETSERLAGDYIFIVEEVPHETFVRNGNDLYHTCTISLAEALSGFNIQLPHLDGRLLLITVNEVVSHKTRKVIQGEGMICKDGRGDLILQFNILFPERLKPKDDVQFLRD